MKRTIPLTILIIGLLLFVVHLSTPVQAAPFRQPTPFPTPTPGPDGRIIYVVQPGDTLWRIAAIMGGSSTQQERIGQLIALNNLDPENPIVIPGQPLLLGLGGPSRPTQQPGPTPAPTSSLPTPTPGLGTGTICVLLFEDINGDTFRQEDELSIPGGAVSINNRGGSVSRTANTTGGEELDCFEDLPKGDYNVSVAVPDGYNPTTVLNYPLTLKAGDETSLDFGAQLSTAAIVEAPPPEEGGRSPILGVIGVALLLGGLGLGVFAGRVRRRALPGG